MGGKVTRIPPKSLDELPAVCLEDDLAAIFRLPVAAVKRWRTVPMLLPFPPLPEFDRHLRVSGCVVAWFLAQDSSRYRRDFMEPLERQARLNRRYGNPPWWKFTAPHERTFWARPLEGERPELSATAVAEVLRVSPGLLRRAARDIEFPMPPAVAKPLKWTKGQLERLLWAPSDHEGYGRRR